MRKLTDTRFGLGRVVMTRAIRENLNMVELLTALRRHAACDWGNVNPQDWKANDSALKNGDRILSSYTSSVGERFWIITEADRSATIVLYPSEY